MSEFEKLMRLIRYILTGFVGLFLLMVVMSVVNAVIR